MATTASAGLTEATESGDGARISSLSCAVRDAITNGLPLVSSVACAMGGSCNARARTNSRIPAVAGRGSLMLVGPGVLVPHRCLGMARSNVGDRGLRGHPHAAPSRSFRSLRVQARAAVLGFGQGTGLSCDARHFSGTISSRGDALLSPGRRATGSGRRGAGCDHGSGGGSSGLVSRRSRHATSNRQAKSQLTGVGALRSTSRRAGIATTTTMLTRSA
jgi:hypothetical protein